MANKPEKKYRAGQLTATVWKNEKNYNGEKQEYYTVSIEKNYKEKDSENWKTTNSLMANDIPKAELVLRKAFEFITLKESE